MRKEVYWFFDFLSPFAFLQIEKLSSFENIICKPVLFAGLLNHWENKGPAEIESKRIFTYRYATWLAHKTNTNFKMPNPHPFNPLAALRLAIYLNNDIDHIKSIFKLIWEKGLLPDDEKFWIEISKTTGFSGSLEIISSREVKDELRANGEMAIEKGVFGVPTFLVDDEVFWGVDATDFALEFYKNPELLAEEKYLEINNIETGAARSRR